MITFREFLNLCEDYNPNAEFVIYNKNTRAVLGTARGFDEARSKASSIRKQRGLKFDDVSFMTSRRFYGKSTTAPSESRRMNMPLAKTRQMRTFQGCLGRSGELADLD
jgi:hypothetical protein